MRFVVKTFLAQNFLDFPQIILPYDFLLEGLEIVYLLHRLPDAVDLLVTLMVAEFVPDDTVSRIDSLKRLLYLIRSGLNLDLPQLGCNLGQHIH